MECSELSGEEFEQKLCNYHNSLRAQCSVEARREGRGGRNATAHVEQRPRELHQRLRGPTGLPKPDWITLKVRPLGYCPEIWVRRKPRVPKGRAPRGWGLGLRPQLRRRGGCSCVVRYRSVGERRVQRHARIYRAASARAGALHRAAVGHGERSRVWSRESKKRMQFRRMPLPG